MAPRMAVYFPKYVTINNPRLAILYWLLNVCIFAVAFYQFLQKKRYNINKYPNAEVSLCTALCQLSPSALVTMMNADASRPFCTTNADDVPEFYADFGCGQLCSRNTPAGEACLHPNELIMREPSSAFVSTVFSDEVVLHEDRASPDSCPLGYASDAGGLCRSFQQRTVPGAEAQRIAFSHSVSVPWPSSMIFGVRPDLRSRSGSPESENDNWANGMKTVLIVDGSVSKEFAPGELVSLSVSELLAAASVNDGDEQVSGLDLDALFVYDEDLRGAALPTRLTGVSLTIDLFYTEGNANACINTKPARTLESLAWAGPICCINIKADRDWTSRERANVIDAGGSVRTRVYRGILVKFHAHGLFSIFDASALFRGVTQIIIWMQIPMMIIYWFSINFLGHLSTVYTRVIHQEMSLADACKGLAARLISHSAAFMDMQDLGSGISKDSLLNRFRMILEHNENLDDNEVKKFVDFVFGRMIQGQDAEDHGSVVNVQGFCTACTTNEPLRFDSLVQIFDRDRKLGLIERAFIDDTIREVHSSAKEHGQREAASDDIGDDTPVAHHSQLEKALSDVHSLTERMTKLKDEVSEAARECREAVQQERAIKEQVMALQEEVRKKAADHPGSL